MAFRFAAPFVLVAAFTATPATACDVTTPTNTTLGPHSPAAIKAAAVPNTKTAGGFSCSSYSVLALLTGNFLKATIPAGTVLKLSSATSTDQITYRLFADQAATAELTPGTETTYMNGTVLNLLNLFGNGAIDVPVYMKLASTNLVAPGVYTGSFTIRWDWYFCSGIGALGLCIGTIDSGSKPATVNVTVTVVPKPLVVALDVGTMTWDPVNGTTQPKAIPGGKRRVRLAITNPDIVPVEANTLRITLPTPTGMAVALDGDGTLGGSAPVQTTDGTPASGLTLTYIAANSASDHVDFSNDAGATWTYSPVAGNAASQGAVSTVRLRPQGTMAAETSFTVSLPYSVK